MNAPFKARPTFGKLGNRLGARLLMDRLPITPPPRAGGRIVLRFFELEHHGAVIWARGDGCAVQFDDVLPTAKLERLRWIAQNREEFMRSQLGETSALWR